jgi:hypothetical protein
MRETSSQRKYLEHKEQALYLGCPDFPLALVPLVGPVVAESAVRLKLAFFFGDFTGSFVNIGIGEGRRQAGRFGIEVVALQKKELDKLP